MPSGKLELLSVRPSAKSEKKYDAKFRTPQGREKTVSFGAAGMDDYTKTRDKELELVILSGTAGAANPGTRPTLRVR